MDQFAVFLRCIPYTSSGVCRSSGSLAVVKCHLVLDDASGPVAVSNFFEIDRLLLQAAPKPFDEGVIQVSTAPIH